MDLLMEHLKAGLVLTLMLSAPIVVTTALVGIVMGILQAVTQIHEQTLTAAPKIVLSFLILIFLGGMKMTMLQNYFYDSVHVAFMEVPRQSKTVLPPKPAKAQALERAQAFFGRDGIPLGVNQGFSAIRNAPNPMMTEPQQRGTPIIGGGAPAKPRPGMAERLYLRQRQSGGG